MWVFHESGPHYVILDSRGVDEGGAFTFTGSFRCPRPRNDHLGAAIAIPCGPIALGGRMNFATNDVDSAGGVVALGRDVAYRFNAMAGDSVFLTYRQFFADPVLFLLEDSDPSRCLVALDRGLGATPETLAYRFPHTGGYTLVLDSRQAASGDVFDLDGAYMCSGGVASVEGPGAEPALVRPVVGRGPFALSARFAVERWRVLDLLGRVRRSLPGDDSRWDGAGDDGRPSPPGVYVVEARGAGRVARATVILLR